MNKEVQLEDLKIPAGARGNISIPCPLCSDDRKKKNTKTLSWHVEKQVGTCLHCATNQYIRKEKMPKFEYNTKPEFTQKMLDYMKNRGISKSTLSLCNVEYAHEFIAGANATIDCFAFKYLWNNVLRMVKLRGGGKVFSIKKAEGREMIFYNIDNCIDAEEVVICEGEFEVLSYVESGITNVLSVPSGGQISPKEKEHFEKTGNFIEENVQDLKYLTECIEIFKNKKKIYLATDADATGMKLRNELVRRLGKHRCFKINFDKYIYTDSEGNEKTCKDANDVLVNLGKEVLKRTLEEAESYPLEDVLFANDIKEAFKHNFFHGQPKGLPVGFECLKPHLNLRLGEFIGLVGYANHGKTTFMLQIALYMSIEHGWKWGIFTPENLPEEILLETMVEMLVGNTADKDKEDRMSYTEAESAIEFIQEHFFFLANRDEDYSHEEIRAKIKEMIERLGINGFILDPFNSIVKGMDMSIRDDKMLSVELSAYVRLAVSNNVLIWINSHPSSPTDKSKISAPTIFSISGGIMWSNKLYISMSVFISDTSDWNNTQVEVHVQKIKNQKLCGVKTDPSSPPIIMFDRRRQQYYEVIGTQKIYPLAKFKSRLPTQSSLNLESHGSLPRIEIDENYVF